jgi:O-acetyl-ADP-ribose deacetylase (regulator of RNase III)
VVDFSGPINSAIVNAANEGCLGGGDVDGAISDAGGDRLLKARLALPTMVTTTRKSVRCPTGQAVLTGPDRFGTLKVPFVVHAVGPNYHDYCDYYDDEDDNNNNESSSNTSMSEGHVLLRSAYQRSLDLAYKHKIKKNCFS